MNRSAPLRTTTSSPLPTVVLLHLGTSRISRGEGRVVAHALPTRMSMHPTALQVPMVGIPTILEMVSTTPIVVLTILEEAPTIPVVVLTILEEAPAAIPVAVLTTLEEAPATPVVLAPVDLAGRTLAVLPAVPMVVEGSS